MGLFRFIFSKAFLLNSIIAVLLLVGGFFFLMNWLQDYTRHGEVLTLKDYKLTAVEDLESTFKQDELRFVVLDTVYDDKSPKGVVIDQTPKPLSKVKKNRTIYLTINSLSTQKVTMPNLTSQSPKIAMKRLNVVGLVLDSVWKVPSKYNGLVLDQLYKGEHIEEGTPIKKGEKIVLKVGDSSLDGEKINIPNFVGLTMSKSKELADLSGLKVNPICPDCMTDEQMEKATVTRQDPSYTSEKLIFSGSSIDIFLTPPTQKSDDE